MINNYIFLIIILILIVVIFTFYMYETFTNMNRIPKKIWTYWNDINNIPDIVLKCIDTWRAENKNYEITILDNKKIKDICNIDITVLNIDNMFYARQSDIARLIIMEKYGGIWMDATIICTESLKWVNELQQNNNVEFIGYIAPHSTSDKYPIIENWFFAAIPRSQFISKWLEESIYMTSFYSEQDYIDHIKNNTNTDIQNLQDSLPYLVIHLCAAVIQQKTPKPYKMYLMNGVTGPFKYLNDNDWILPQSLDALCIKKELTTPLIKLRGEERRYIKGNLYKLKCNNYDIVNKDILHVLG
jgi:hypothetical protein